MRGIVVGARNTKMSKARHLSSSALQSIRHTKTAREYHSPMEEAHVECCGSLENRVGSSPRMGHGCRSKGLEELILNVAEQR